MSEDISEEERFPPPRKNPLLFGHEAAEETLRGAFESGRFHHAWLLGGEEGVGKATLAFRFARFVLAQGSESRRSTKECGDLFAGAAPGAAEEGAGKGLWIEPKTPLFQRVASGGHADLLTVERGIVSPNHGRGDDPRNKKARTVITVNKAHEIGAFLHLTPAEGGFRVVIVDSADEMNLTAANAILKPLEEPPQNALLLLVSHAPGRLLPTIRSRCRLLRLFPLERKAFDLALSELASDLTAEESAEFFRLSRGSPGKALRLMAQGGLDLQRELMALLASLPETDVVALHALADRAAGREGEGLYRTFMDLLSLWLGRLVRWGARRRDPGDAGEGEAAPGEGERVVMERLLAMRGLDHWVEVWENLNRLFAKAESVNLDRKQVVLNAFFILEKAARS